MRASRLLVACFTLFANTVFSQSLYQDAKALAIMLRGQSETNTHLGNFSFEFRAIKPMHHIYINPTASLSGLNNGIFNAIQLRAPGDFLLRQVVPNTDTIVVYRAGTDSAFAELPVQHPYYLIRIKRLDAVSSGQLEIFAPTGALLLAHKGDFKNEPVAIKVTKGGANPSSQNRHPLFLNLGEVNIAQTGAFSSNRLSMENPGRYFFENLAWRDTLRLMSEGKVVLTLYAIEMEKTELGYGYVLQSAHGTDTLPGGYLVFRNTSDQVFLTAQTGPVFFQSEIPVLKKSVLTTPELMLEPAAGANGMYAEYAISRSDSADPEGSRLEPLDTRRMSLESARYNFKFTEPRTQIIFYRDGQMIDTMEFSSQLSFAYQRGRDNIVLKTAHLLKYEVTDVFPPVTSVTMRLDSFWLVGLALNTYSSGSINLGTCFHYSKYSPETDRFEPFSPEKTQQYYGDLFFQNGLYHAYLDEEKCPLNPDLVSNFKFFQPRYWDGKKRSNQMLPIHWNPFAGPGPRFNPLEFLIDDGKVTFFYVPALKEETRTIFLQKKDKLPTLLGTHARLKEDDLHSPNLWGEISADYRSNPLLGKALRNNLAANAFEELPGVSNAALTQQIEQEKSRHYAWQQVVYDHAELKTDAQVSYEDVVSTYRTPVTTASDNLQLASEQFGSESKKLKRGLSTAAIAAGLSDFVVQRAQEELNITFLDRMRDGILSDTAEFRTLFPQTGNMLGEFKIVQYRTLLDFAKNAFVLDLRNLGLNFPKLFSLYKYRTIKNDPKVYNIFLLYDIANKVYEGMPVDTVLLHVHSRLQERRADLGKSINLRLATTIRHNPIVRDSLEKIIEHFSLQLSNCAENFMFLNDAYGYQHSLLMGNPDLSETAPENFDRAAKLNLHYAVDSEEREYQLARNNLKGDPDYPYVLEHLPFNRYQEFFAKPPDTAETISAGIAMAGVLFDPAQLEQHMKALDNVEEGLNSIKTIKMELEARKAKSTIDLSDLIPSLEAFKEMQIRRMCLDLALEIELAYLDNQLKTLPEHDRQSLVYLQKTLRTPEKYQLYDWQPIKAFYQELLRNGLDTCSVREQYGYQAVSGKSGPLNLLEQQRILVELQDQAAEIRPEIEKANAFLQKMAATIEIRLQELSNIQASEQLQRTQSLTQFLFEYLLLSDELTNGALAFSYDKLLDKMTNLIRAYLADQSNPPTFEIYAAGKDSVVIDEAVQSYLALIQYFETQFYGQVNNLFLGAYDKIPRFDRVESEEYEHQLWEQDVLLQIKQTRESVAALEHTGAQYHQYLETLKQANASDLLASLQQTEEFATLTEITLQWLYAFKSGSMEMDSIVALDSVVQRVTLIDDGQDGHPAREISYDSIQVQPRQIASGPGVRQWITPKQFNEVMEDTLLRQAYLGLLYQRLSSIEGGPKYAPANMALLATKFMNTIYEVDDNRESLRYKKRINQQLGFEDYYPFIRTTIDLLNIVLETPPGASEPLKDRFPTLAQVPAVSNEVLSLFENVFAENYPNAIRNVVQLLSITWGLDKYSSKNRVRIGAPDSENPTARGLTVVKPTKAEQQLQRQNQQVKSAILVYGSFMANMVGAQTPNQVKAAIQAVAVPPGSSSVKRKSSFNVALNGYFGAGFHNEILTSSAIPDDQQRSSTFGLSVPIGLTASIGGLGKSENWSYSLFLPIIDVGAITAYRLNQGNTQSDLPELSFSNLIAPGAYVLVNFPKSPFTVGAGAQFGPQARKITINGLEQSSGAWRYGIVATIDVPIFNLFSR